MLNNIIKHPVHGRGIVQETRYGGFELRAQFDTGLTRWVRRDQVEAQAAELPNETQQREPLEPVIFRRSRPRRIIESLRMGVVPDDCVDEFTFGRDEETAELKEWLASADESALALIGAYGTGKTHLLNYVRSYASQEGYAVAFVEMDPQESPFSKPKRVYNQLITSLRYRPQPQASPKDARWLLKKAFAEGLFADHRYFGHIRVNTSDTRLWEWIEARETPARPYSTDGYYSDLPGLYDHGTAANIYCHLLSSLGWASRQIGLRGLLLIFDEAETLYTRQSYAAALRSNNFLEALIATSRGDTALLRSPEYSSYDYSAYAPDLPFLYQRPSGMKVLLAFTFDSHFYSSPTLSALRRIYLDSLDETALQCVLEQISTLYAGTYRLNKSTLPLETIREIISLESGTTRRLIKGCVEALDIMRFNPAADPFEVLI